MITACFHRNCLYIHNNYGRPSEFKESETSWSSVLIAYTYIVGIFTSTSIRKVVPVNLQELIVSLVLAFCVQYQIATLASGFANFIIIENSTMSHYQHDINKLKIYLKVTWTLT